VVSQAGGPGVDFTELQVAAQQVPDGSVLLVRPGSYAPVRLDGKGLTILADPGVVLNGLDRPAIEVVNLGATQSFTLRGGRVGWGRSGAQLRGERCAGQILVEAFTLQSASIRFLASAPPNLPCGVEFVDCARVALREVVLSVATPVFAARSSLSIE